uniref:Secreted protein n=1 Tax=Arundo donax TaxID=35708 RepID=A0A0A8YJU6_ARUDO
MLVRGSILIMTRDLISLGELFVMLVCMPTWEELGAGEMTLNPLHTHLFFFSVAASLGKDAREKTKVFLSARKRCQRLQRLCVVFVHNLSDILLSMS